MGSPLENRLNSKAFDDSKKRTSKASLSRHGAAENKEFLTTWQRADPPLISNRCMQDFISGVHFMFSTESGKEEVVRVEHISAQSCGWSV